MSALAPLPTPGPTEPLLQVRDLAVQLNTPHGWLNAVNGVNLTLEVGQTLAIIGESGSGKSVTARALMGLLDPARTRITGSIRIAGTELVGMPESALRRYRGRDLALILQDPGRALNPTVRIGKQISEAIRLHTEVSKAEAQNRSIELLDRVRIPSAKQRYFSYAHELSGGMRQRVMIAMALACSPRVLIADEATTALDVTTQAQVLELLQDIQAEYQMAILLISHDMGLAASYTDSVAVMYAGQIVETAPTTELFAHVRMPYTRALLDAIPKLTLPAHTMLPVTRGRPPDLIDLPPGCSFADRCKFVGDGCVERRPALIELSPDHEAACWYPLGLPPVGEVSRRG